MLKCWRIPVLAALVSISLPAWSPAQNAPPAVTLERTELHTLRAGATTTDYRIYVALPNGYAPGDTTRYPILYVLDGNTQFALTVQAYRVQAFGPDVRPAIIVGIGYPAPTAPDIFASRSHDLTPTRVGDLASP